MIALSEVLLENGADFKAKTKREHSGTSVACVSHIILLLRDGSRRWAHARV